MKVWPSEMAIDERVPSAPPSGIVARILKLSPASQTKTVPFSLMI